jgi:hypothetical protein
VLAPHDVGRFGAESLHGATAMFRVRAESAAKNKFFSELPSNLLPGIMSGFDDGEMDLCYLQFQYGIVGF